MRCSQYIAVLLVLLVLLAIFNVVNAAVVLGVADVVVDAYLNISYESFYDKCVTSSF